MLLLGTHMVQAADKEALGRAIRDLAASFPDIYLQGEEYLRPAWTRCKPRNSSLRCNVRPWWPTRWWAAIRSSSSGARSTSTRMAPTRRCARRTSQLRPSAFGVAGSFKVLDAAADTTRVLLDLPPGIARDPVVRFDGRRILFSPAP